MALLPDSRHRAPFAHQSSSANLRSGHGHVASLRSPPTHSVLPPGLGAGTGPGGGVPEISPTHIHRNEKASFWGGAPLARKDSNDLSNGSGPGIGPGAGGGGGGGYNDNPYAGLTVPGNTGYAPHAMGTRPSAGIPGRASSPGPFTLPQFTVPAWPTIRFVSLCFLWYGCSAVSNNTGKVILNNFKYPVTLTIIQFFFVGFYCIVCSRKELGWTPKLRSPTRAILKGILPMAAFQVGGHIFSSMAISRVPVSTVHTIKALSPLFTVAAYALLFGVSYSPATYLSLLPLTFGVMLASSADISFNNFFGLVCAMGSTLVFVSQNIFFKKIMPTPGATETGVAPKLDKINLLYFSSSMAFVLMIPVWIYSDAWRLVDLWFTPVVRTGGPSITFYLFLNGTVHFAQNLLAFSLLSSTSPVTYSIASLVKRIAVICLAIIWFKQSVFFVQAVGIALTAVGLLMYNNAKRDVEKGEKKMRQVEAVRDGMLPTTKADQRVLEGRANLDPATYGKIHNSPVPSYPPNYIHLPSSTSTAYKKNGFYVPPPAAATAVGTEPSYPPPPLDPSDKSPSADHHHTVNGTRHRGTSAEGAHFRFPPSTSTHRAPAIPEHAGGADSAQLGLVAGA
ncbi:hypothetical protein IAU60_006252 [Kwoniella sp. DSM 27419]